MTRPPNLKTAMTPFPYSVGLDASLEEARQLMQEHRVRHLPVTEAHTVVGLVTDRDIRMAQSSSKPANAGALKVSDLYISDPYIVSLDEPIDNVLLVMAERHIGSAIITKAGRLAGMFTAVDACRCFGEYLRANFPRPGSDNAA
ncbi:MAG: CBS domain-containing protein [Gammaproteobacteria bacterium]